MKHNALGGTRHGLAFVAPAFLIYTAIILIPILWSFGYSFFTGNALGGFKFVGFNNYAKFVTDPNALSALWFTIRYAVVITVGQVLAGYGLSLLYVFFLKKSSAVIRTIVFFPVVLPTVAVALLFQQFFALGPNAGPINALLQLFGGPGVDFLGYDSGAFLVIVIMDIWRSMGFYAILLYTGLVDIPEEVIESARIDGAGGWRLVRSIVIPLSVPVLLSSIIFSVNGTLKVFDTVLALTNGGPGTSTTPLTLYMFLTSFTYGDYGYGSTIAIALTILCLLVTVFIFRSSRRDLTR